MATLTVAQMVGYAKGAGLSGNAAVIAGAVGMAESGGRTDVVNFLGCTGIWQVYVKVHKSRINSMFPGEDATAAMKDPAKNAKVMAALSNNGANWRPWEAYTNGSYKKYMQEAMRASGAESISSGASPTATDPGGGGGGGMGDSLAALTSAQTWWRVLWAIGGVILVLVALSRMTGIDPTNLVPAKKGLKLIKAVT